MADVMSVESKIHGLGVFATRDFAEGETILPIDDSHVVDDDHPLRCDLGEQSYHCDYLAGGKIVVASFFELPLELQLDYLPLLNEWFIEEHAERVEALRNVR